MITLAQLLALQSEFKIQKQCSVKCRQDMVVSVNYTNLVGLGAFFQNYTQPTKMQQINTYDLDTPEQSVESYLSNMYISSETQVDSSSDTASSNSCSIPDSRSCSQDSIEYPESLNTFTPITLKSLETLKKEQHIHYDLTHLESSTESLLSLAMYARYNHIITLDWSIETTLYLMFMVKPLGLYRNLVNDLLKRIETHLNYGPDFKQRLTSFVQAMRNVLERKKWADVEFVIGLLTGLKTLVSKIELVCVDCAKEVGCLVHKKVVRNSIVDVPVFLGGNLVETDYGIALMILASSWLLKASRQVEEVSMLEVRDIVQRMQKTVYSVPKTVELCLKGHEILPFWKFLS